MSEIAPVHFHRARRATGRSPEYVQLSTAAAITLGVLPGRMYRTDCTHCLNLLLTYPEGCRANCAYCGLARHREEARAYAERNFIRVEWPVLPTAEIVERVARGEDGGRFQRMCISMISHPASMADTLAILAAWRARLSNVPVSILSNPTTMTRADLVALKDGGADIFTVALDAATPEIFERTRGKTVQSPHRWTRYWEAIAWAAEIFGPEKFGVHLIAGLGETERELLSVCQRVRDLGGHNHLFAFFPERGSLMEDWPPVPRDQWRRVQLARYLIDYGGVRIEAMAFDAAGRVVDFGIEEEDLRSIVASGRPFRTSGCPGPVDDISACNRPYGDSPPSDIRSFPYAPHGDDLEAIMRDLGRGG